eukprot:TRINITY_DN22912_c0_g1_i2.p1 TRINITY_DN22912_c0_g1~~TRINITY_DN22912_c0_g1_i2.p1  ORF type:complete len:373 (-),score=13.94 TRINITY_DN22912_c0_g1_i2:310-1428(-)
MTQNLFSNYLSSSACVLQFDMNSIKKVSSQHANQVEKTEMLIQTKVVKIEGNNIEVDLFTYKFTDRDNCLAVRLKGQDSKKLTHGYYMGLMNDQLITTNQINRPTIRYTPIQLNDNGQVIFKLKYDEEIKAHIEESYRYPQNIFREVPGQDSYMTMFIWKESLAEHRAISLSDCFVRTKDKVMFYGNMYVLATSSNVVYNTVVDTNTKYSVDKQLDLSPLFNDTETIAIHFYLCMIYNDNCELELLYDIVSVLKLALKLDNESLVSKILENKCLDCLVDKESLVDECFIDEQCHVINLLNLAQKHNLTSLQRMCELKIIKCQLSKKVCGQVPQESMTTMFAFAQYLLQNSNRGSPSNNIDLEEYIQFCEKYD